MLPDVKIVNTLTVFAYTEREMDLPSTTVDDILSAADVNESAFEVSSTAVAHGNIATNVDVGSIRLEDILNEQSDDDDDGNVGNIYTSVENPPYVSPNTIDLVNDSLVKEAREYVRSTSASPPTNRTSPRTSEILQQILDEDETDDTDQFLQYLNGSYEPQTSNKQDKPPEDKNVRKLYIFIRYTWIRIKLLY